MGPTFHFTVPELRFGTVSYGFASALKCVLENTSLIPMQFTLAIPQDEAGSARPWRATDPRDDDESPRARALVHSYRNTERLFRS